MTDFISVGGRCYVYLYPGRQRLLKEWSPGIVDGKPLLKQWSVRKNHSKIVLYTITLSLLTAVAKCQFQPTVPSTVGCLLF